MRNKNKKESDKNVIEANKKMHATNKIASRKIIHNDSGRQDLLSRVLGSASSGHAIKVRQAHRTVAVALSVAMTMTSTHLAAAEELKR